LFFGNPETQESSWDCDCRPSDGIWLSIQSGAPFFVKKSVWEDNAGRTADVIAPARAASSEARGLFGSWPPSRIETAEEDTGQSVLTKIKEGDPEVIKRLKVGACFLALKRVHMQCN
jgi:Domain of unknown function (DUF151)